jgi:hypothetical protein
LSHGQKRKGKTKEEERNIKSQGHDLKVLITYNVERIYDEAGIKNMMLQLGSIVVYCFPVER